MVENSWEKDMHELIQTWKIRQTKTSVIERKILLFVPSPLQKNAWFDEVEYLNTQMFQKVFTHLRDMWELLLQMANLIKVWYMFNIYSCGLKVIINIAWHHTK